MNRTINVTIVGAGHYARDLIARKYQSRRSCRIRAILSPTVSKATLAAYDLGKPPLVRSPSEWFRAFGRPTRSDIFDLCVHFPVVPGLVKELARSGAKNFVFPKVATLSWEGLRDLLRLKNRSGLRITVASQWHYSGLMPRLRALLRVLSKKRKLDRAVFDFSQTFSPEQLDHYSPSNALLPHILQIAYSSGLCRFDGKGDLKTRQRSWSALEVRLREKGGLVPEVLFVTDLARARKVRTLSLFVKGETAPVLTADFIGLPDAGCGEGHWVAREGKKYVVWEDNLKKMVEETLAAFKSWTRKKGPALTLERYAPIMRQQIRIEEAMENPSIHPRHPSVGKTP